MKRAIPLLALLFLVIAAAAQAEPSRGFTQERAAVANPRTLSVDLNTNDSLGGTSGAVRMGVFGGELILNEGLMTPLAGQPDNPVIGRLPGGNDAVYKLRLDSPLLGSGMKLAVYGGVAYNDYTTPAGNNTSNTNVGLGSALTWRVRHWILNFNPQVVSDDANNGAVLNLDTGAFYRLDTRPAWGAFELGGEYDYIHSYGDINADNVFALGVRWLFKRNVTLDFMLLRNNLNGSRARGVPGMMRLNVAF
ncbi:MAG TPA: hypothetical protein VFA86_12415 [Gammaproteobacteria bacterium]|nr:hypothetical protein [Gammaproteobacteria bacterium]